MKKKLKVPRSSRMRLLLVILIEFSVFAWFCGARKIRYNFPIELLLPVTGQSFHGNATNDKLLCFGNRGNVLFWTYSPPLIRSSTQSLRIGYLLAFLVTFLLTHLLLVRLWYTYDTIGVFMFNWYFISFITWSNIPAVETVPHYIQQVHMANSLSR